MRPCASKYKSHVFFSNLKTAARIGLISFFSERSQASSSLRSLCGRKSLRIILESSSRAAWAARSESPSAARSSACPRLSSMRALGWNRRTGRARNASAMRPASSFEIVADFRFGIPRIPFQNGPFASESRLLACGGLFISGAGVWPIRATKALPASSNQEFSALPAPTAAADSAGGWID